jgi:hypothetical protein
MRKRAVRRGDERGPDHRRGHAGLPARPESESLAFATCDTCSVAIGLTVRIPVADAERHAAAHARAHAFADAHSLASRHSDSDSDSEL